MLLKKWGDRGLHVPQLSYHGASASGHMAFKLQRASQQFQLDGESTTFRANKMRLLLMNIPPERRETVLSCFVF